MGMKQKIFFFLKKKIQNGRLKKTEFFNYHQKLSIFHGLVLGLIGLMDVKGIDVAEPT